MLEVTNNDDIVEEIAEFVTIQTAGGTFSTESTGSCSTGRTFSLKAICNQEETFLNNRQRTLALIDLYKKYKPKVGSYDIRSMKKFWEIVATDISNQFKITISASKCENRWKTLERNYKKVIDNNNKTGRDRKIFEFENEFDTIYGKKKNIIPTVLLSSNSITTAANRNNTSILSITDKSTSPPQSPVFLNIPEDDSENRENTVQVQDNQDTPRAVPNTPQQKRKRAVKKMTNTYKRRNEILLEMKNDLQQYYKEKSNREEQKLVLQRLRHEDRLKRTSLLEAILENRQQGQ
ncbi:uncharacterized protein LOC115889060 [Sitophilus oryzae]|uniref:Uncharacterized protein LOC115889060 n=1 Tax=Sitophilus oryzae TaxID=7048 RepID=A0A6J2YN51_SITOR|nr:uncharacterized protein LOC115889060 [Sitophilus oryzae]